jgi:hypothetical protein
MLGGDLADWLEGEGDETRELIVEARTQPRFVRVETDRNGKPVSFEGEPAALGDRAKITRKLHQELTNLLDGPTTLLKAAGAVVVRANREQLRKILSHPLVKAVRPNRLLKKPE